MLFGAGSLTTVGASYLLPGYTESIASVIPEGAIVPFAATATTIAKTDGVRGVGLGGYEFVLVLIDASDVASDTALTTGSNSVAEENSTGSGTVMIPQGSKIGVVARATGVIVSSPLSVSVTVQLHPT